MFDKSFDLKTKVYPTKISIVWTVDDVYTALKNTGLRAEPELTSQEAAYILHEVGSHHDANVGVTWDTLVIWAKELFGDRMRELENWGNL